MAVSFLKRLPKALAACAGLFACAGLAGWLLFDYYRPAATAFGPIDTSLSGFAWSGNFGWVSFNSNDCDVDDDGTFEGAAESAPAQCPSAGAAAPYGVIVDSTTKRFSGYAWGEHLGWLYFGPDIIDDTGPGVGHLASSSAPNDPKQWPRAGTGGQVDGWASVLSLRADYWDRLGDTPGGDNGFSFGGSLADGGDGYVYALIGNNAFASNHFYRYSKAGNVWEALAATPAGVGRGADLVYPGSGDCIYALRGNGSTALWCYSKANNNWATPVAGLPVAVNAGGSLEHVNYNGKSYLFALRGGNTSGFYRYDIAANIWLGRNNIPAVIGNQGHLLAYPGTGKYLYSLIGSGRRGFYRYDLETGLWSSVNADTPQDQDDAASLVSIKDGKYLYASLGEDDDTRLYRFDIAAGSWEARNDLCYGNQGSACKFPADDGLDLAFGGDGYLYASQGNNQARFFRYRVGDDNGWVKMTKQGMGGSSHKVLLDENKSVFYGWAWGGSAAAAAGLGWLSFNFEDCDANKDGTADGGACGSGPIARYFVKLGAGGPRVSNIAAPGRTKAEACDPSLGAKHVRISYNYSNSYSYCYDNAGNNHPNNKICKANSDCTGGYDCETGRQKKFQIVLKKSIGEPTGDATDELTSGIRDQVLDDGASYTFSDPALDAQLAWGQKYYVWVKIWDSTDRTPGWRLMSQPAGDGDWVVEDGDPGSFTMANHELPLVSFNWTPENPSKEEYVSFQPTVGTSSTAVYRTAAPTTAVNPTADDSWYWTFDNAVPSTSTSKTIKVRFTQTGNSVITLTLTDKLSEGGYSCSTSTTINTNLRLPDWRENNPK